MANSLLTSIVPSGALDPASLTQTLDHLLERYLTLLHQHQILQQELSQALSSVPLTFSIFLSARIKPPDSLQAFLSLAQANFQSSNRAHYGQDFYDERMQASTLLCINPSPSSFPIFSLLPTPGAKSPTSLPPPPEQPSSSEPSSEPSSNASAASPESTAEPSTPSTPRDPLTWFGILVPPALRNAQRSFNHGARDLVPQMAGVVTEMRALEIEVRRVRKKMAKKELAEKGGVGIDKTG